MNTIYETDQLIIKILDSSHAESVLNFLMCDRELFEQFEPIRPLNYYTPLYQKRCLEYEYNCFIKSSLIRFWIFSKKDPEVIIGTCAFYNIQKGAFLSSTIGYKFASSFHHKGYATEAISKCIDIIFDQMGLHKIESLILPTNTASIKLMERLNFTFEGISKDFAFINGKWEDHKRYSLCNTNHINDIIDLC